MTRIERATRELMTWLGLLVENAEPRASLSRGDTLQLDRDDVPPTGPRPAA